MNSRTRTSLPDGSMRSSRPCILHSFASLHHVSDPLKPFSTTSFLLPFHLFLKCSRFFPSCPLFCSATLYRISCSVDVTGAALSFIFNVRQRSGFTNRDLFIYRSERTRDVDSAAARGDDDDPVRDQHTVEDGDVSQTCLSFLRSLFLFLIKHPHRPPTPLTNPHPLQKHVFYLERFYSWHIQK